MHFGYSTKRFMHKMKTPYFGKWGNILMSLFGNLFDFNGDGKTDFIEEMMGLEILSELEEDDDEGFEDE